MVQCVFLGCVVYQLILFYVYLSVICNKHQFVNQFRKHTQFIQWTHKVFFKRSSKYASTKLKWKQTANNNNNNKIIIYSRPALFEHANVFNAPFNWQCKQQFHFFRYVFLCAIFFLFFFLTTSPPSLASPAPLVQIIYSVIRFSFLCYHVSGYNSLHLPLSYNCLHLPLNNNNCIHTRAFYDAFLSQKQRNPNEPACIATLLSFILYAKCINITHLLRKL